jgi:hypothetical protein
MTPCVHAQGYGHGGARREYRRGVIFRLAGFPNRGQIVRLRCAPSLS